MTEMGKRESRDLWGEKKKICDSACITAAVMVDCGGFIRLLLQLSIIFAGIMTETGSEMKMMGKMCDVYLHIQCFCFGFYKC